MASYLEKAKKAIPAEIVMISGCKDEQTSADVSNVAVRIEIIYRRCLTAFRLSRFRFSLDSTEFFRYLTRRVGQEVH